jgi:hypothetical protein
MNKEQGMLNPEVEAIPIIIRNSLFLVRYSKNVESI